MDSSREIELEARLVRIEQSIAVLQRSVDALLSVRAATPGAEAADRYGNQKRDPLGDQVFEGRRTGSGTSSSRNSAADDIGARVWSWLSSRSPEWWLSRVGMGLLILAVVLLYGIGIDKGWITPPVRILAGTLLGGILLWAATRTSPTSVPTYPHALGFRELLFGGALAVWYVTAYAASVWYQLISIPSARLAFFALAILSIWIALQERREIFATLAVATGFATPFILMAPAGSMTELSLYLGLMTAMGLTIYLMRGWPSIVWMTFVAFWFSVAVVTNTGARGSPAQASIALSVLVVLAAAAFVRIPALRRQLLHLGSDRYTPSPIGSGMIRLMDGLDSFAEALGGGKSAPDSLVLWVLPLASPILAVGFLESIWPAVPDGVWGFGLVLLGAGAFMLARRSVQPDAEVTHVEVTAAVLWTVLGIARIASTPESIPLTSAIATYVLISSARFHAGARAVAKATIAIALMAIIGHELSVEDVGLLHLRWILSGFATVGCAGLIAQTLIEDPAERVQGMVLAVAAYLAGLTVVWRALEPLWPPLVTTSYAVLGAVLLVVSRRPGTTPLLRQLGAVTMLIVVARLLLVDLSSVETIWRVLLFLVCGAVFLYTGYRMQPTSVGEVEK
ncbi:MAG: DUF2339 domain-containing protein [Gemmatimonadota bacterium]|nr:DUF2339 domain-containing protein [Gemmatimonadota bacterium]